MRVIYEAENLIDAHLVRGLLEQAGIPVFVRGEYLTGAIGELPPQGLVAVMVPTIAWPAAHDCLAEYVRRGDLRPSVGDAAPDGLAWLPA